MMPNNFGLIVTTQQCGIGSVMNFVLLFVLYRTHRGYTHAKSYKPNASHTYPYSSGYYALVLLRPFCKFATENRIKPSATMHVRYVWLCDCMRACNRDACGIAFCYVVCIRCNVMKWTYIRYVPVPFSGISKYGRYVSRLKIALDLMVKNCFVPFEAKFVNFINTYIFVK